MIFLGTLLIGLLIMSIKANKEPTEIKTEDNGIAVKDPAAFQLR